MSEIQAGEGEQRSQAGVAEMLIVWVALTLVALEIFVTYTRTPIHELYKVRHGGVGEGASRALAFVGFPVGLIAIAMLCLIIERVPRRRIAFGATAGSMLVVAVAWPGAVDEAGLEASPAKVLAALGVSMVLAATMAVAGARGIGRFGRHRGDLLRVLLGVVVLAVSLPWMAADLGLSLDQVPGLNRVYLSDVATRQPSRPGLHSAVHDGHHHGMDGSLLVLAALLLSRSLAVVRSTRFRVGICFYLAVLFVYGVLNAFQDAWLEQIVKRGWSGHEFPMMLSPSPSVAVAIFMSAGLITVLAWRGGVSSQGDVLD